MKRLTLLAILLFALVGLVACPSGPEPAPAAPAQQPAQAPAAQEQPAGTPAAAARSETATIGYTSSVTGKLNVEFTRQTNGLNLWMKQINDAGGLKLKDGALVKFDSKFYDDESNNDRIQELYTRLSTRTAQTS